MSKLAVDVVLIPDEAMSEKAIAISGRLQKKENGAFRLGRKDYLPHITLTMGVLDEDNLGKAIDALGKVALRTKALPLVAEKLEPVASAIGGFVSGIDIGKTPELRTLLQSIVAGVGPLFTFDATTAMFVQPETVKESSALFIKNNYPKRFDWNEFPPHLTIGRGATTEAFEPTPFTASTLALCHLGQYNTCRKVLTSFELRG